MTVYRAGLIALLAGATAVGACSSGGNKPGGASDAGAGGEGADGGKGGSAGKGGSGAVEPVSCEDFGFVTNGIACPQTGCRAFGCDCEDDFPVSLASCTPDGCLLAADCEVLCAAGLGEALSCDDTYTVDPRLVPGGGGSSGSGGSGGSGGSPPAPMCQASYVNRPPATITPLPPGSDSVRLLSDEAGNVYLAGVVPAAQVVDLGGGELPSGKRLFLVKRNAQGEHVWSRRFGTTHGLETVDTFAFAADGTLLMGGITPMGTDLGGGAEPGSSAALVYAARYDVDGTFLGRYLLPTTSAVPNLAAVVQMPSGEVNFWGDFSSDFAANGETFSSKGEADIFFVRFSAAGEILDAKSFGGLRNDLVFDAVADAAGNTYLLGFSFYEVNFGSNPIDLGDNALSFVVRLNSAQTPVWQKLVGSGGSYPRRAALAGDELVVAGDANGQAWYEDSVTGALPDGGAYVLRVDTADGSLIAGDTYGPGNIYAHIAALSLTSDGGVALGGYAQPPVDFGGGLHQGGVRYDPFALRVDAGGEHSWSTFFCSTGSAEVTGIGNDADSSVLIVDYTLDLTLGAEQQTGTGTVLLDMPAEQ